MIPDDVKRYAVPVLGTSTDLAARVLDVPIDGRRRDPRLPRKDAGSRDLLSAGGNGV